MDWHLRTKKDVYKCEKPGSFNTLFNLQIKLKLLINIRLCIIKKITLCYFFDIEIDLSNGLLFLWLLVTTEQIFDL